MIGEALVGKVVLVDNDTDPFPYFELAASIDIIATVVDRE